AFGADDYDTLSERGVEQARVLGRALAPALKRATLVVSGEMQRHRQTAQTCLAALGRAAEWRGDADWNEFGPERIIRALGPEYADMQRLRAEISATADPHRAFQRMFEAAVARWIGGAHDADYAETWQAFRARCRAALQRVHASLAPATDALVFT